MDDDTTTTINLLSIPDTVLEHIALYLWTSERSRWFGTARHLWHTIKPSIERKQESFVLVRRQGQQEQQQQQPTQDIRLVTLLSEPAQRRQYHPDDEDDGDFAVSQPSLRLIYQNWNHNLRHLDLGSHATDLFWKAVTIEHGLFPQLRHVAMVGSQFLTDQGLRYLAQHNMGDNGNYLSSYTTTTTGQDGMDNQRTGSTTTIESIDITFCRKTSYAGTFCLRDNFKASLRVLRRQPTWLDGHFHTPFGEDNNNIEVHTYYPDGSFSFTRNGQSRGYVHSLEALDAEETLLRDKLQYVNFEPPPGWPTWTLYSYRPGVCLLRLPEEEEEYNEDDDGNNPQQRPIRTVLVGQSLRKLRPPVKLYKLMKEHANSIPTGASVFFNAQGERLDARPADSRGCLMISKMSVYPLQDGDAANGDAAMPATAGDAKSWLPPDDLVADCRTTCEALRDLGQDLIDSGEILLNEAMDD